MAFSITATTLISPANVNLVLNQPIGAMSPYQVGDIAQFGAQPQIFERKATVNGREVTYYCVLAQSVTRNGVSVTPPSSDGHLLSLSSFVDKDGRVVDIAGNVPHIDARFPVGTTGVQIYNGLANQSVAFVAHEYRVQTERGIEPRRLTAWR